MTSFSGIAGGAARNHCSPGTWRGRVPRVPQLSGAALKAAPREDTADFLLPLPIIEIFSRDRDRLPAELQRVALRFKIVSAMRLPAPRTREALYFVAFTVTICFFHAVYKNRISFRAFAPNVRPYTGTAGKPASASAISSAG